MIDPRAESSFRQGLEMLQRGQARNALAYLRAAVDQDGEQKQARYASYYGLCLSMNPGGVHEGLRWCRCATEIEPERAEVWCNLGRVALAAGRRAEAYRALDRGRQLDPGHASIAREMARLGVRRSPVLSFLGRGNPLNVVLGRLRTTA